MSYDVYKDAVLRVLPEAAEIPLEAPPTEAFDLQDNQTCPACGSSDATVQVVEDTEVARCPQCQCEFPPRLESISRRVIRGISERRERRFARFVERLSPQLPVAGLDQHDYDLFRKIVDGLAFTLEPDRDNRRQALEQIHARFVQERVDGFADPNGVYHPPVAAAEAERRWRTVEPTFRNVIMNSEDENLIRRLRLGAPKWTHSTAT